MESPKIFNRNTKVIAFILSVVFCIGLWVSWNYISRRTDGPGFLIISTARMLRMIALGMQLFVEDGEIAPTTIEQLTPWLEKHGHGHFDSILKRDNETGAIVDNWRTPIRLIVKSPSDYILMSFGPNKKD